MENNHLKNLLLHLRIPFSVFLMPVFWFALTQNSIQNSLQNHSENGQNVWLIFIILHLLVYPSSNGYNSYMDNDTESIGGIKTPPKVPKSMFLVSVLLDFVAIIATFSFFSLNAALILISYILASRAYSYRGIRLKKYPVIGFLTVAIFQGCVIFSLLDYIFNDGFDISTRWWLSLAISFLLVGAGYPLTQVYQHKQDKADDVQTLSLLLGVRGTFVFSAILFALLGVFLSVFLLFFGKNANNGFTDLLVLSGCLAPVAWFFGRWFWLCFKDETNANFENTMRMNLIGSVGLNLFFLILLLK